MGVQFSLSDLEAFDPHSPQRDGERRLLCPLCGHDKPRDAAHRSLCLNTETGAWRCWRCSATGKLTDFWQERPVQTRRARHRAALSRAFDIPSSPAPVPEPPSSEWRTQLRNLQSAADTPGEAYLIGRGIPIEMAHTAGVRFSAAWFGRPAVVFPLRDRSGALVAAQGRYVDGRDDPKARTVGEKRVGLFATPDAFDSILPAIILSEAPLDALSLAVAGYPALALCGTSGPEWLPKACAFRRVMMAFDADEAGDRAADELSPVLRSFGARPERMRPEEAKDWNEALQLIGREALTDYLSSKML